MRIISIQLKNIKSHRDTELSFSPGINVLSGANGCGKSTIFEAIGYALFGVNAQDFVSRADRFLTIGAKRGEVSVVFEPSEGGCYRVTRTVGPAGKWLLAKESGGSFEIEEHANSGETELRIASLLGLASGRPLADQFKLVIGPFQNDFLGPFVIKQPTRRQEAFDEILGIDAWRKTFDGTKSLASAIVAKSDTLHAEVEGKKEQVAVLPEKRQELKALTGSAAAKRVELGIATEGMERVAAFVVSCEAQKERLEAARNELSALQERIASGKDHVATQQLLTKQSLEAEAIVAESRPGKLAFDTAEERLEALRIKEQRRGTLEKELARLETDQAGIRAALESETRELGELEDSLVADAARLAQEEEGLTAALARLKEEEKGAGLALTQATQTLAAFRELPLHRIDQALPYLKVALERIAALELQAEQKRPLVGGIQNLRVRVDRLPGLQEELERIQGERSEITGRRLSLVEGRDRIGTGDCPYFHEPCKNLQDGGGVEVFTSRIAAFDAEIVRLDAVAETLSAEVGKTQEAARELAGLEQVEREIGQAARERESLEQEFSTRLAELSPQSLTRAAAEFLQGCGPLAVQFDPKQVELVLPQKAQERGTSLQLWSDRWHRIASELEKQLTAGLKQAEEPVHACAMKLGELSVRGEALKGRKNELAVGQQKAQARRGSIAAHGVRLASLQDDSARTRESLSAHAGLPERIAATEAELKRYQPDRDRYIANQRSAEELEKHQVTLARYQGKLRQLEEEQAAKAGELRLFQEAYQAEQHEAAKAERERLLSAVATLQAELASLAEGTARLEGEIAALAALAEEIDRKLSAIKRLQEQGTLVKFLRNQVFKNVSAQLSERFREEISFRADRIYRSIAESDEELCWGENYQVVLRDMADGAIRERSDDQLSGGQMMSAVVALRLALLQTIGARIAFFDEPTSNLDAERRENLARAFRAIDVGQEEVTEHWYDQLFLVSHDVSFTEITDQTIQLDGKSGIGGGGEGGGGNCHLLRRQLTPLH